MLWLALHLPLLSLEAFCATLAEAGPQAVALVAEHRISAVNATAAAAGVRAGMKRATALALAPDLLLGEADAARDAAALTAVAHAALAFTPSVAVQEGRATVLMEVRSSLRLFGGLAALHAQLLAALAPLAHRVQMAAAPTAWGAAMLAEWGEGAAAAYLAASRGEARDADKARAAAPAGGGGRARAGAPCSSGSARTPARTQQLQPAFHPAFHPVMGPHATQRRALVRLLDAAPVWLLGPGREHWEALQGMGLQTLSDLRALPRAGLTHRFGEALLEDLDKALGAAPDPRRWIELPARFESQLELHHRADSAEQVLAAAAVLLARLVAWAAARHGRIAAFTLVMKHEPRHQRSHHGAAPAPATELRIELAEPTLDAAHLHLLLRERLARLRLAAPTLELRLRCREVVAGAPPNAELFPTRGSEALGLARLLERLRARLGDAQVRRLDPAADHRPERASRGVPALALPQAECRLARQGAGKSSSSSRRPGNGRGKGANTQAARARGERLPIGPGPGGSSGGGSGGGRDAEQTRALPLHRPVWLLPEPLPLPERHSLPVLDGQPLQLVSGPERIEAGWWDGELAVRDYFIAQARDGSLVWVWRRRLPVWVPESELGSEWGSGSGSAPTSASADADDEQWMLQGRFA